jgi:hypothetical protein
MKEYDMKKILTLIIAIITISILAGCSTYNYINSYPVNIDDLTVEYIRTNGYYEDIEYPLVFVIKDKDQLESYFNEKKDKYNMESDGEDSFSSKMYKYDSSFFESNILIALLIEEPSGSIRHEINSIKEGNNTITFGITREVPENGTTDMAQWHILISMPSHLYNNQNIDVEFN